MTGRRRARRPVLTHLECEVMRSVWRAQPEAVTVRHVLDELNRGRARPLAYNTVQTMLTILSEKGVLEVERTGRAHRFRALRSQHRVTNDMVGDLVDRLFDGRVEPLLLHLVERESLSEDELRSLRRLIDEQLGSEGPREGQP